MKKQGELTIIAECKKGSPSAGILRKEYDPLKIARSYQKMGASAISVLTDEEFFLGSLSHLKEVSSHISLPIIRKDFIIDELQIEEAYAYGASAILLIVRILDKAQLKHLYSYAKRLGLDVIVETHNEDEIQTALDLEFNVIGINTRDLDTFKIHNDLIHELSKLIPNEKVIVGESGVSGNSDLKSYLGIVDSLLIGTYFMKSPDIETSYRTLISG